MKPLQDDTSDSAMAALADSDLARVHGGADGEQPLDVKTGVVNAPFAVSHYMGAHNLLLQCANGGKCPVPSRMLAGAMLGAGKVPVDEIVKSIQSPLTGIHHHE